MLCFSIEQRAGHGPQIQILFDEDGLATLLRKIEAACKLGHIHIWGSDVTPKDSLDDQDPWGREAVREVVIDYFGDAKKGEGETARR